MGKMSFAGTDTVIIDDRPITDLFDGTFATLTYPNDIASGINGFDNNTAVVSLPAGEKAQLTLRLLAGNDDDKYLNQRFNQWKNNKATFVALSGTLVKHFGDGTGQTTNKRQELINGYFLRKVDTEMDAGGGSNQTTSTYILEFAGPNQITL